MSESLNCPRLRVRQNWTLRTRPVPGTCGEQKPQHHPRLGGEGRVIRHQMAPPAGASQASHLSLQTECIVQTDESFRA